MAKKPTEKKQEEGIKTLSMSNDMLQLMSYFESQYKARSVEAKMWNSKVQEVKESFLKSRGIEREKFMEDWDEVWVNNTVKLYKKPEEPKKEEEVKQDAEKQV